MISKYFFVSFASDWLYKTLEKLVEEVKNFKKENNEEFFDEGYAFTDIDLKQDKNFWNKHGNFIERERKGYGFWIWKSYIILNFLEKMKDGDILLYMDAGCSLQQSGLKRFMEYIDIIKNSNYGILSFEMEHLEKEYTKMDTMLSLNCENLKNTKQLVGGIFMLKKCDYVVKLVKLWYESCCNYHLLDDSFSTIPNDYQFKEHRHDQSIFSLLRKNYGTEILKDETYFLKENGTQIIHYGH